MGIALNDPRVRSGILTPTQVASLIGMKTPTLRTWTKDRGRRPTMVHTITPRRRGWPSVPLVGLAEASSLLALRQVGVKMSLLADAAEYICERYDDPFALANPRLVTDGTEAFAHDLQSDELWRIRDRQVAFTEVLREHLRPLILDADDYVKAYRVPLSDVDLFIEPGFSAGRMTFANKVPVFAVIGSLRAGEEPVSVALDYGLPPSEVAAVERHIDWLEAAA